MKSAVNGASSSASILSYKGPSEFACCRRIAAAEHRSSSRFHGFVTIETSLKLLYCFMFWFDILFAVVYSIVGLLNKLTDLKWPQNAPHKLCALIREQICGHPVRCHSIISEHGLDMPHSNTCSEVGSC